MENKNIYDKIFDKPCEVCGKTIKKDVYEQGECPFCGWYNCILNDEYPDNVAYPNLISLNKAKKLYREGKSFEPNLDEFVEALHFYSEVQFEYKGIHYGVVLVGYNGEFEGIEMFKINGDGVVFKTDEDFKNNAKIGNEYLKDIWDKTTDRYWL